MTKRKTTSSKPRKPAARKPQDSPGAPSRRTSEQPGQESPDPAPATLAGDLKPGDRIVLTTATAADVSVLVEHVEHMRIGDVDRVRVRLYGRITGIRTTVMLRADIPITIARDGDQ